jgi:hypothetical protein
MVANHLSFESIAKPNVLRASCSQTSEQDARNTLGHTANHLSSSILLLPREKHRRDVPYL